jgi:omega-amidase
MLTFTLIQTNLFWEDKAANLAMLQNKIENIKEHTEVIILPEMFTTGFSMQPQFFAETMDGETVEWMRHLAIEKKAIICGSIMISEAGQYFNRFIWMLPNGQYGYYDKRHLFAYAGEDVAYSRGNKRLITQAKGWKINCNICYDLRFPVWSRQSSIPSSEFNEGLPTPKQLEGITSRSTSSEEAEWYDVLLYVANWPDRRINAWKTLLVARAIENQCYVIGVNRVGEDGNGIYHSGSSMVINPMGEVLFHQADDEIVHTFTLDKEKLNDIRIKLPFLKDADDFLIK